MNVHWFPGHMAKTRRMMAESLKIVDIAAELVDARLPLSSRNPEIDKLLQNKERILILNKSDMADQAVTEKWIDYFAGQNIPAVAVSASTGKGIGQITAMAKKVLREKQERDEKRGIRRNVKMMVCGIPNVGKSSFINRLAGRASTKTGDRPGVTRGKQWIRLKDGVELLDMPGILWPKFDNQEAALRLAYTGAIRDEIMDVEELACQLLIFLKDSYREQLCQRYQLEEIEDKEPYEILEQICKKRGFLLSGGRFDTFRGANILLDEFRDCKLGCISLESPDHG